MFGPDGKIPDQISLFRLLFRDAASGEVGCKEYLMKGKGVEFDFYGVSGRAVEARWRGPILVGFQ